MPVTDDAQYCEMLDRARNGGATAIWTSDAGSIDIVHDICTQPGFTSVTRPSISNSGAVAFMAASGTTYDFVVRAKNGALDTIASPGTSTTSVGPLTAALEPAINNNDVVTFMGQGAASYGLFTGAGGALTTISLDNPSTINGIDDSGRVAFVANSMAVQTGDGGAVTTIAARTTEGGAYESFGGAAISAAGKVAFMAYLPSGQVGVFTGPDPEADVVLKAGDVIPGFGTVTFVSIMREAINDSGQVAMNVRFNDAGVLKAAIIRADPPNTPPIASDGNISVVSGSFASGTLSGSDADGEPFTFALVSNGSKGTAVLDNASTGAFTYTADAGTSGDDTFTFQVTDSRGLTSNVATITVGIESACAVDVTSSIQAVKGKGTKDTGTTQTLSLSNNSAAAIAGPISVVLDSLSPAGTALLNAAGVTSCTTPAGSPYVNVDVGADSIWSPGERVEVVLEFSANAADRGKPRRITYVRRVLAGAGTR